MGGSSQSKHGSFKKISEIIAFLARIKSNKNHKLTSNVFREQEVVFGTIYNLNYTKNAIVYIHGIGDTVSDNFMNLINQKLGRKDFNLFFLEYPGYGENRFFLNKDNQKLSENKKTPSSSQIIDDLSLLLKMLIIKRGYSNIFLLGHSLGTGIIFETLSRKENHYPEIKGVFLMSSFKSIMHVIPFYKSNFFGNAFDFYKSINNISLTPNHLKWVLIHGKNDKLINYHQSCELTREIINFNKNIKLILTENTHDDIIYDSTIFYYLNLFLTENTYQKFINDSLGF